MRTIVKHYKLALCKRTTIVPMYKSIHGETKYAKNIKAMMDAKAISSIFMKIKKRFVSYVKKI